MYIAALNGGCDIGGGSGPSRSAPEKGLLDGVANTLEKQCLVVARRLRLQKLASPCDPPATPDVRQRW